MENKDSLEINKVEIKKDRGDNLKRAPKSKAVLKKDLEIIKDRGDSVPKPEEKITYPKNIRPIEKLNKNLEKNSRDFETVRGVKGISKKTKQNEGTSKISKNTTRSEVINSLNKNAPRNTEQNEKISKGSDKYSPALITDKDSVLKPVKDNLILKHTKHIEEINKTLHKTVATNITQNENSKSSDKYGPALITDKDAVLAPIKDNVITKNTMHNEEINKIVRKNVTKTKQNEEISKSLNKSVPIKLVTNGDSVSKPIKNKVFAINAKFNEGIESNDFDKTTPKNKPIDAITKNFEKSIPVVRKNIVENEKHVNRLDINEKKRIREKYTFKLKGFDGNKKLGDKSNSKDSQVEDHNDISKSCTNEGEVREKTSEDTKSERMKIDKIPDSTEKSRKCPVIRTVVAKNDATKVYKAVTFVEQRHKSNTPLQIKIPVSLKNTNIPNDTVTDTKLPKSLPNNDESENKRNAKTPEISQSNGDNLTRNIKKPKISPNNNDHLKENIIISKLFQTNDINLMRNVKNPKIPQINEDIVTRNMKKPKLTPNDDKPSRNIKITTDTVMRNSKIPTNISSENNKIPKLLNIGARLKKKRKIPKISQGSESRSSVKTKISKKKRNRLKSNLSHFSLITGNGSPPTEVAKWAPCCINQHTQPYYEAWVDTTLTAISKNSKKESQNLVETFKNLLQQRNDSPELMYENYLDERYTGKIKVNCRQ